MNNKIFNGGPKRKSQHRITVKAGAEEVMSRSGYTTIPKRIEALFIAFTKDIGSTSLVLTREELDLNPATRLLPNDEKDLLVKYWPTFQRNAQYAVAIGDERKAMTNNLSKAQKDANVLKRKNKIDGLSQVEQLRATSHVCAKQFVEAAHLVCVTPAPTESTTELEHALYKARAQRARDFAFFAKTSADLAFRIEEITTDDMQSVSASDEAQELLDAANAELHKLGFGHLSAPDIVDEDGDE